METKINIAEILKDNPIGIKLYSSTFGYIKFNGVHKDNVYFYSEDTNVYSVKPNGKMYDGGECIIFPSKEMRDWSKFSWKKGDVLVSIEGSKILFDKWANEDYTKFLGKIKVLGNSHCYDTANYSLASKEESLEFIKSVEKINNGKLNLKTLRIEKSEFKDGDVMALDTRYIDSDNVIESFIVRGDYKYGDDLKYYAGYSNNTETDVVYNSSIIINKTSVRKESLRLATEKEKQQLFDALAKEGKVRDAEKKMVVNLKSKVEFKPFDKVLVRDSKSSKWRVNLFSHKNIDEPYYCVYASWNYCIPYKGNEHLLGTTKDMDS